MKSGYSSHILTVRMKCKLAIMDIHKSLCLCSEYFTVEDNTQSQKKITVEDLFSEDFRIHDPEAKWISGKFCKR